MEMVCRFQVNPLLVSLGVVYDHNLVVKPVYKTFSTTSSFPIEFPYVPTKRDRFAYQNLVCIRGGLDPLASNEKGGTNSQEFSNGCSSLGGTLPVENVGNTSSNGNVGNKHGVPVGVGTSLSSLVPIENLNNSSTCQRLGMWHSDTNGTIFRMEVRHWLLMGSALNLLVGLTQNASHHGFSRRRKNLRPTFYFSFWALIMNKCWSLPHLLLSNS